jgi:hypothetical protein
MVESLDPAHLLALILIPLLALLAYYAVFGVEDDP